LSSGAVISNGRDRAARPFIYWDFYCQTVGLIVYLEGFSIKAVNDQLSR
jgi:hypothetical protein